MYLLADQAGRTSHAAGRTGVPEETAEGEASGQGERKLQKGKPVDRGGCADHLQKVLEDVLVLRDVTRFYLG